jgi:hypothetical protein
MINLFCIRPKGFNIGNDVIHQATLAFIRRSFGSQVNVISLPATSRYETQAKAGLTPRTVHEINQYGHGVIVGGGNLYENGELEVDTAALDALEPPLMLFSLGAGRIYNRRHELVSRTDAMSADLVRLLNEKAAVSLVRDDATAILLARMGSPPVHVAGCPTLFFDEQFDRPAVVDGPSQVLFSVRTPELMNVPPPDQARVRTDILGLIDLLGSWGLGEVKLLCHDHRDLPFAASFDDLEYLYTDDVGTLLEWLRTCRLSIGYRLHAALPSLALGTPAISISYDERALSMMRTIGYATWDINMIESGDVTTAVGDRLGRLLELPRLRAQTQPRWRQLRAKMTAGFDAFARHVNQFAANLPKLAPEAAPAGASAA